ncbi:hypothetical protein BDM02DRAFT_3205327 [Thelephora ganbajun]|uniref:Uncharacterized protein n=1 Tax=Thelephora ganbajun TaxID=370292 RepID=A0ACB6Z6Y6_THEGA|nr:hypothetical protein BDM02DRAFT_3205327 [Thelephora ganbajun]
MSNPHQPHLPPEILDYIVDLLHDEPETLKQCCLVSKSWASRTRKHLFANVEFFTADDLEAWKQMFPDPARSPAHHTHTLSIHCIWAIEEADAEDGGWIPTFSRVNGVWLRVGANPTSLNEFEKSLTLFHKLSPLLKSLRVGTLFFQCSRFWNVIRSLPLLEDLTLIGNGGDKWESLPAVYPSASPAFTGTLELDLFPMEGIVRRLLDLPNGLHFRRLVFSSRDQEDLRRMEELVAACSDTLECLDVMYYLFTYTSPASVDLSKATKLRDVVFRPASLNIAWITMVLQNVSPEHRNLQRISIYLRYNLVLAATEPDAMQDVGGQWLDLDHLLVQFWESRSIRTKLVCSAPEEELQDMREHIGRLLPEVMGRGIIDLVE